MTAVCRPTSRGVRPVLILCSMPGTPMNQMTCMGRAPGRGWPEQAAVAGREAPEQQSAWPEGERPNTASKRPPTTPGPPHIRTDQPASCFLRWSAIRSASATMGSVAGDDATVSLVAAGDEPKNRLVPSGSNGCGRLHRRPLGPTTDFLSLSTSGRRPRLIMTASLGDLTGKCHTRKRSGQRAWRLHRLACAQSQVFETDQAVSSRERLVNVHK